MKKHAKFFVCFVVCALLVSTLALGAGRRDQAAQNVITHWYWADSPAFSRLMQEMVEEFNATNTKGITVVAHEFPWDGGRYSENVFIAAMGGGAPDTAAWKLTATPLFTANRLLAPLDSFINTWADRHLIEDSLWEVMRYAGGGANTYVMPWNTQVLYVYYRPSMFRAAGIGVPRTYQEFLDAVRILTRDGVYGFGMRGSTGGHEPWGSFIHARGGDFYNLTSPQAIQGMRDFVSLFTDGFTPRTAPADGFHEIISAFRSGLTAMTIHHTGSSVTMQETFGDDVGAFAFPAGPGGRWTSMGDTNNVIFQSSRNKEAAFYWLAWLATGRGQETWNVATGNVPVSRTVQQMPFFQDNRFMRASIDGAPYAGILPILPTTTEFITVYWPNTVAAVLTGLMTVEEAMAVLQRSLHGN